MPEEQREGADTHLQLPPGLLAGQPPRHGSDLEVATRIGQRQIVRQEAWVGLPVAVFGHAWPFVVALFGIVVAIADFTRSPFSDRMVSLLLLCSFLGAPVV